MINANRDTEIKTLIMMSMITNSKSLLLQIRACLTVSAMRGVCVCVCVCVYIYRLSSTVIPNPCSV
jgi:hypothetical protein